MMSLGRSDRGLSLVTTTMSACEIAAAPMRGRLVVSLLPPQPKTTQSRPVAGPPPSRVGRGEAW